MIGAAVLARFKQEIQGFFAALAPPLECFSDPAGASL
jgi:hypothetical protein